MADARELSALERRALVQMLMSPRGRSMGDINPYADIALDERQRGSARWWMPEREGGPKVAPMPSAPHGGFGRKVPRGV